MGSPSRGCRRTGSQSNGPSADGRGRCSVPHDRCHELEHAPRVRGRSGSSRTSRRRRSWSRPQAGRELVERARDLRSGSTSAASVRARTRAVELPGGLRPLSPARSFSRAAPRSTCETSWHPARPVSGLATIEWGARAARGRPSSPNSIRQRRAVHSPTLVLGGMSVAKKSAGLARAACLRRLALYLFLWPVPIDPVAWEPPPGRRARRGLRREPRPAADGAFRDSR